MKTNILTLLTTLAFMAANCSAGELPLKSHPDSKGWKNLFAEDFSDAINSKGVWSCKDGEFTATEDQCLWTKDQYQDFVLDLEFKMGDAANSGVIVHCTDPKDWIPHAVEIQILDDYHPKWAGVEKNWKCAGIFGHLPPTKQTVKKAGEWNRMTIACKSSMIYVMLNNELVTEADMKQWTDAKKNPDGSNVPPWLTAPMSELVQKGHIGFQGKHGGAPIFFRNIKLKPL